MKITCPKNQFLYGVNTVSKAVSNKVKASKINRFGLDRIGRCFRNGRYRKDYPKKI